MLGVINECIDGKWKDLEVKKVELEKIIEKIEKEEDKLKKELDKVRKMIEDCLIKVYDKICIFYCNGLFVVFVECNFCGGCFNKILLQL